MAAALMCAYLRDDLAAPDAMTRLEQFAGEQGFQLAETVHTTDPQAGFEQLSVAVARAECQHVVMPSKAHLHGVPADRLARLRRGGVWIWFEESDRGGGAR
ncbi:hypothetical protein AB0N05_37765 [Nocardia sp. NPDC051030]|uniref:hypothetical protein n=1 Tax=Nocardia sp. NPDC051030 TaxID=3155162 RepID=UPI0034221734